LGGHITIYLIGDSLTEAPDNTLVTHNHITT